MRKTTYLWKNKEANFCFDFSGVGIIDFVNMFEAFDGKLYLYGELPTAFFDNDSINLSLLKEFDIADKIDKIIEKSTERKDLQHEKILKKIGLKHEDSGTSLIVKIAPHCELPKLNYKDIDVIFKTGIMPNEILGICMIHDMDWRAVSCFNCFVAQEIINQIKVCSQVIVVRGRNELPM